jgi:hypothetical protein
MVTDMVKKNIRKNFEVFGKRLDFIDKRVMDIKKFQNILIIK